MLTLVLRSIRKIKLPKSIEVRQLTNLLNNTVHICDLMAELLESNVMLVSSHDQLYQLFCAPVRNFPLFFMCIFKTNFAGRKTDNFNLMSIISI